MKYELRKWCPGDTVHQIHVVNDRGHVVFSSSSYAASKAKCARLNAGGEEVVHFDPGERRQFLQRDGSVIVEMVPVEPRCFV